MERTRRGVCNYPLGWARSRFPDSKSSPGIGRDRRDQHRSGIAQRNCAKRGHCLKELAGTERQRSAEIGLPSPENVAGRVENDDAEVGVPKTALIVVQKLPAD